MARRPPPIHYDRHGIAYYRDRRQAESILASMCPIWPDARIVSYLRGYALQIRPGGAYWTGAHWTGETGDTGTDGNRNR